MLAACPGDNAAGTDLGSVLTANSRTLFETSIHMHLAVPHLCTPSHQLAVSMQVVSARNANTIIVNFDSFSEHKLYRKRVRKTSRIVAHDEEGAASAGDYVRIVPCRPVSKTKRFRLDAVIKKFAYNVDEQTGEVAALGACCADTFPTCCCSGCCHGSSCLLQRSGAGKLESVGGLRLVTAACG